MFTKFITAAFICLIMLTAFSQNTHAQIDSVAVVLLDKMSDVIADLESCTFELKTEYDLFNSRLGLVKHSDAAKIFLKAPDKLFIKKDGDGGNKSLYCDGKTLTYYSAANNQYSVLPALPTIMETIDSIHNEYDVDFPAADVFYPDFVEELLDESDDITYLGLTFVDGKECHHIAGTKELLTYQYWINSNDNLPAKMVLVFTSNEGNPQYEVHFFNWILNPVLDDSMFNFVIPEKANKVIFKKKI